MNCKKVCIIISLITFVISFSCINSNAMLAPEGVESITGIVTEINSNDMSIKIGPQFYYFQDASVMKTMLETINLSINIKALVFYKKIKDKNLIIHIKTKNIKRSKSGR